MRNELSYEQKNLAFQLIFNITCNPIFTDIQFLILYALSFIILQKKPVLIIVFSSYNNRKQ